MFKFKFEGEPDVEIAASKTAIVDIDIESLEAIKERYGNSIGVQPILIRIIRPNNEVQLFTIDILITENEDITCRVHTERSFRLTSSN